MNLGTLKLKNPFIAAPMAGISSPAYRMMAKKGGAGLVYTEMVSAKSLVMGQRKSFRLAQVLPRESPAGIQLFGADPEDMARAAALVRDIPADVVDVNMGCPAKKVRKQGAGSALLEDPVRAAEVARAVVENAGKPVSVKLRLGKKRMSLKESCPAYLRPGRLP
jgi:tRNA-dihydrouridine synthase B